MDAVEYEQPAVVASESSVSIIIPFADGTRLRAEYWRVTKAGRPLLSNFDHRQQYGWPKPIDAVAVIRDELGGKQVLDAAMVETSGDLRFRFDDDLILEVFNFTGYEIWEVTFPDGTGELSNYALMERKEKA